MFGFLQNYLTEILVVLFGIVVLIQLFYYLALFSRFSFHKPKKLKQYNPHPVSIVVCAKNEAHHLMKSLPVLLTQQYNDYEVVVINDNSDDETAQVILDFKSHYPHLKFVNLTSTVTTIKGKKFPLSIGIKSATYDYLLLTDADCVPSSPYWLQNMSKHFVGKTEIVLGYGAYEKKKGLLGALAHFDTLHTAIQYFSYALAKIPYMGVGRNLAYTKELFFQQKGFSSHNHILSGDDDLFVNKAATKQNCDIEYAKEAMTISKLKPGFSSWVRQKKRHFIAGKHYKSKHKFMLGLYGMSMPLFYVCFAFALYFSLQNFTFLMITVGLFVLKAVSQYLMFGLAARKLDEKRIIPFIILFDLSFSIINPLLYLFSSLTKKHQWK